MYSKDWQKERGIKEIGVKLIIAKYVYHWYNNL